MVICNSTRERRFILRHYVQSNAIKRPFPFLPVSNVKIVFPQSPFEINQFNQKIFLGIEVAFCRALFFRNIAGKANPFVRRDPNDKSDQHKKETI